MSALKLNSVQATRALGVSDNFVSNLVRDGLIQSPPCRPGGRLRIDADWVAQLVAELEGMKLGKTFGARAHALRRLLTARAIAAAATATKNAPPAPAVQQPLPIPAPVPVVTGRAAARDLGINPARISEALADSKLTNLNPVPGKPRAIPVAQVDELRQALAAKRAPAVDADAEAALALAELILSLWRKGRP